MKIFDLHCDTAGVLYQKNIPFKNNILHINAKDANRVGPLTQCFAVFLNDRRKKTRGMNYVRAVYQTVFPQIRKSGVTPIFTVEGGGVLADEGTDWIGELKRMDCRMFGLVWNGENPLATGAVTDDAAPLKPLGVQAVKDLTDEGILLDVSHLSTAGTHQILTLTEAPIVASHSNARALCTSPRNLTDGHATEIFRRGGLVGLNLYPPFLTEGTATLNDLCRHAEHFLSLGGERGLCLGCDLDGVEKLPEGFTGIRDLPRVYELFSEEFGETITNNIFYNNAARLFGTDR